MVVQRWTHRHKPSWMSIDSRHLAKWLRVTARSWTVTSRRTCATQLHQPPTMTSLWRRQQPLWRPTVRYSELLCLRLVITILTLGIQGDCVSTSQNLENLEVSRNGQRRSLSEKCHVIESRNVWTLILALHTSEASNRMRWITDIVIRKVCELIGFVLNCLNSVVYYIIGLYNNC